MKNSIAPLWANRGTADRQMILDDFIPPSPRLHSRLATSPHEPINISQETSRMTNRRRRFTILGVPCLSLNAGACIDLYYEWPVEIPGDPPSSMYTFRHVIGVKHGWFSYSTDDIFAYDDLAPAWAFSVHPPRWREPLGRGGWVDFGIAGIAPWFIAILIALTSLLWPVRRTSSRKAG